MLAIVGKPMAVPTGEWACAVENRNAPPTARAKEPCPCATIVAGRPFKPDRPFFTLAIRVRQKDPVRFEVHRWAHFNSPPLTDEGSTRHQQSITLPPPHIQLVIIRGCCLAVTA